MTLDSYNVKIINYPNINESSIRIYEKGIKRKSEIEKQKEKKQKENKNIETETENKKEDQNKINSVEEESRSIRTSRNRTKNKIYDYARANNWDWFITLTLDPEKVNRYNYDEIIIKLKSYIDYLRRRNPELKYLIVPELHEDGAYHFHGLISNINENELIETEHMTKSKQKIYNIKSYNIGFTTATKITSTEKASNYITKYITKELSENLKNKKKYWNSKNLNVGEIIELNISDGKKLEEFQKEIKKMTTWEKVVEVETENYKNKITYMEIKMINLSIP